jgi:hypothetical protein
MQNAWHLFDPARTTIPLNSWEQHSLCNIAPLNITVKEFIVRVMKTKYFSKKKLRLKVGTPLTVIG